MQSTSNHKNHAEQQSSRQGLPPTPIESAQTLLQWARRRFGRKLVMSTSFGTQSAVTLHLATQIDPNVPVVWIDTGYLPKETYQYATTLTRELGLNLHHYESHLSPFDMEKQYGRLWEGDDEADLNLYDQIRKVEPMQRALNELNAEGWVSGLRTQQTEFRQRLPAIRKTNDGRYRIYPILKWSSLDVQEYMKSIGLPQHPLTANGYATVGDTHSSRPVSKYDKHERDTRFRGRKQECGLHFD
ncbi:MAG: phosphoadenylyl-sulfate reductase [Planctomycetaceae bacterium]